MQVRHETDLTSDTYVKQRAWHKASLPQCPVHLAGGCGLARHGTYERATPPGVRVARWYCRKARQTFSALPDFLAARLRGTLQEIEAVVVASEQGRSLEVVAGDLRRDIELPGALRWLRRRRKRISVTLLAAVTLVPGLAGCEATICGVRKRLDTTSVLTMLRQLLEGQLSQLASPVGFAHRSLQLTRPRKRLQHKAGTDPPTRKG